MKHSPQTRSVRFLQWLNFFLADVQTGLGPFVAAYLVSSGWNPGSVGFALTFGGLVTVAMQTPAGAAIDATRRKRFLLITSLGVLVCGAILLIQRPSVASVYGAQLLIGGAAPFLAPTVAAITLGIIGNAGFDRQFGENQAFNSAGNVFTAILVAWASYKFGYRAIFVVAALFAIPAAACVLGIDDRQINYARARGISVEKGSGKAERISDLLRDRVLLKFLVAVLLFHSANAAMLPQLGEMLSRDNPRAAAPFMSACIIVTQVIIAISAAWLGKLASTKGRKLLLLLGFGVLPVRGVLYTLVHRPALLIAIQTLDGIANAVFVVVAILVIKDRTQGTGRFNLAAGVLATTVGVGAALSNAIGGLLIQKLGYRASFLGLAGVALVAFCLMGVAIPETLPKLAAPEDAIEEA
ncbi:MAG: arabinose efflux permease family protein [Candidatus Acidoferrum typicum]|nr:arabinose efflux permease family protein [Candidatus Acidoferrum typicum]